MWAVPTPSPQSCTRGSCVSWAWGFFAGEQDELVVQSCLLLPGCPHLLGCLFDDTPGVPNKKFSSVFLWVKPAGEDLQGMEVLELVKSGRQGPCGQNTVSTPTAR